MSRTVCSTLIKQSSKFAVHWILKRRTGKFTFFTFFIWHCVPVRLFFSRRNWTCSSIHGLFLRTRKLKNIFFLLKYSTKSIMTTAEKSFFIFICCFFVLSLSFANELRMLQMVESDHRREQTTCECRTLFICMFVCECVCVCVCKRDNPLLEMRCTSAVWMRDKLWHLLQSIWMPTTGHGHAAIQTTRRPLQNWSIIHGVFFRVFRILQWTALDKLP